MENQIILKTEKLSIGYHSKKAQNTIASGIDLSLFLRMNLFSDLCPPPFLRQRTSLPYPEVGT